MNRPKKNGRGDYRTSNKSGPPIVTKANLDRMCGDQDSMGILGEHENGALLVYYEKTTGQLVLCCNHCNAPVARIQL